MRDRKEYNEQLDDFSRLVRQKLEGHRIPVDADSWTEIEHRLNPPRRRRLWWIAGAAATVAVLVSVYLFRPQDDPIGQLATVGQVLSVNEESSVITEKNGHETEKPLSPVPVKKTLSTSTRSVGLMAKQTKPVETSHGGSTVTDIEKTLSTDSVAQEIGKDLSKIIADAGSETDISDSVPAKPNVKQKEEPKVWLAKKKDKKEKGWLLAASFSSNGGAPKTNDADAWAMPNDYSGSPKVATMENASLYSSKDPYSVGDAKHSLPLSLGISVRKNINDRFAIETGLTYTYLSSRFGSGNAAEAKQELHYLGIPLNAVVYLWSSSNWNIYISAGGMGEKGLRRNYTYTGINSEASISEGINHMQWSLNASVGISYRVYKDWGIYFEPKYSYFFDNDQPASIRTDNKNCFGFNGGIRFEF